MSAHANAAVVRRWFGEIVNGKTDPHTLLHELDQTISADFVDHDGPDPQHGYQALRKMLPLLLKGLPDAHFTIDQLVADDDLVAVRLRGEATHTAELAGIPPTGKRLVWTENEILRLRDGRIVESWGEGTLEDALAEIGFRFGQSRANGAAGAGPAEQPKAALTPAEMDAIVDEHFRAEAQVDIDAILATYADQIEFEMVGNPEGVLRDKAAIAVFYNMLFGEMTDLSMQRLRRWYGPSHLVDDSVISAKATGRPFGLDGKGRAFTFRLLHVFDFEDGRISRESSWLDMGAIVHQLA